MATLTNELTKSQCSIILAHLQSGQAITTKIARQICKCERLAARIKDLRNKGYNIMTTIIYKGRVKYASY
ncbi:helix-turn-helix domain-containing protein, partial [Lacticaseibacillus paracasei]